MKAAIRLGVSMYAAITAVALIAAEPGLYSRSAVSLWSNSAGARISSPDRKKAILVQAPHNTDSDETHAIVVQVDGREYRTDIGLLVNAEVAWSPDSKAFFLNYSDGGNIGTYHAQVFYVDGDGLRMIEPVPNGRKLLAPICFEREVPNVAAIKWLGPGSSRILVAVQVPPHSSCASMGTFRAYEVSLTDGKVLAKYDQIRAKHLFWNDLGTELRNAEDACIQKPQNCVPGGLNVRAPSSKR